MKKKPINSANLEMDLNLKELFAETNMSETEKEKIFAGLGKYTGQELSNAVYEILTEGDSAEEVLRKIESDEFFLNHKEFGKLRLNQEEEDEFMANPAEVEEGVLQCSCGSWRTWSYTLQTCSGDEATSVWAICVACGNKWKA